MNVITNKIRTEPVAVVGSIVTAGTAVLGALVTQGVVHLTADQIAGWIAAGTAVFGIPITFLVRNAVTPVVTLEAEAAAAAAAPQA